MARSPRETSLSRRRFVQAAATASVVAPAILSGVSRADEKTAANDRLQIGFIGVGMMGRGHLRRMLTYDDVQVMAICEVEKTRRETAQHDVEKQYAERTKSGVYHGCDTYTDFRELLARDDIDAVLIATPDHGHAIPCLQAARAKKDIYCEKPLTHNIHEGRLIADAVRENKVVFQTGSQQRSEFAGRFRLAANLIRNGRLGTIKTVRIGVGPPPRPCDLPEKKAPQDVDWEMWVGPAPWRGYNEILCPKGIHRHFPAFRQYQEFAGGSLADMGAHHFDIAQWALEMDASGPIKIEPPAGDADTGLKFTYANGVVMYHGGPPGCTFEGTAGKLYVNRPIIESDPPELAKQPLGENDRRVYLSENHHRNWLDCIKSRKATVCPAEVGHRSATVCHLANLGYRLRRTLHWDPQTEQFKNDDDANALRSRTPRTPWSYT